MRFLSLAVKSGDEKMQILIDYAMRFNNTPYRWGGDDPIEGYDCSGLVQDILASVGQDPPGDQTAQGLFNFFSQNGIIFGPHKTISDADAIGAIAFFGKGNASISHVGFIVSNSPLRMIEAGGGGSHTQDKKDAARQNAFVRVRPVGSRKDIIAIIRPHYLMMRGRY